MKVVYKVSADVSVEVDAPKAQDVIRVITELRESLSAEPCGKCQNTDTHVRHRNVDGNDFYEVYCPKCHAVLQMGTSKDGQQLYRKRLEVDNKGKAVKDTNGKGKWLPDNGWKKWNKDTAQME